MSNSRSWDRQRSCSHADNNSCTRSSNLSHGFSEGIKNRTHQIAFINQIPRLHSQVQNSALFSSNPLTRLNNHLEWRPVFFFRLRKHSHFSKNLKYPTQTRQRDLL